jgi:hypothetical protein
MPLGESSAPSELHKAERKDAGNWRQLKQDWDMLSARLTARMQPAAAMGFCFQRRKGTSVE